MLCPEWRRLDHRATCRIGSICVRYADSSSARQTLCCRRHPSVRNSDVISARAGRIFALPRALLSVDSTETAAGATLEESDPLGSFPAEDRTHDAVSVAGAGVGVPAAAEAQRIREIPVPRFRATRGRLRRRPVTRISRLGAFVRGTWTKSQNWNSIRRLKTVRERREVSRWAMLISTLISTRLSTLFSMPFSIFAAGVLVGALSGSPGGRPYVGLEDRRADRVGLDDRGADLVGPKDRGPDPVGSATSTSPAAVGTTLMSAAPSPAAEAAAPRANQQLPSPGHRGTLIVRSQPVGASVYVNNRLAGRTPLVMNAVPAGSRAIRLSLDGYAAWSRGVSVVANQSTAITAKLETIR